MASETSQSGGRGRCAAAGTGSRLGRYASDSVSRSGTVVAQQCVFGYRCGTAAVDTIAMIDLSKICSYNVACGYTDLRLGIDGFAAVVTQQFADHLDGTSASK